MEIGKWDTLSDTVLLAAVITLGFVNVWILSDDCSVWDPAGAQYGWETNVIGTTSTRQMALQLLFDWDTRKGGRPENATLKGIGVRRFHGRFGKNLDGRSSACVEL